MKILQMNGTVSVDFHRITRVATKILEKYELTIIIINNTKTLQIGRNSTIIGHRRHLQPPDYNVTV